MAPRRPKSSLGPIARWRAHRAVARVAKDRRAAMQLVSELWQAASTGRIARHWPTSNSHINALLAGPVATLRARMRNEVRRNPWAAGASEAYVSSTVSIGIRPIPQVKDAGLRKELLELFADWSEEADADGRTSFYGLTALAARELRDAGEVFARRRDRRPSDGFTVPMQIQLMEAEQLDPAFTLLGRVAGEIRAGIEFGPFGNRVAYHFWRQHPGDLVGFRGTERTRVLAEVIAHVFEPMRAGQLRGYPGLASSLATLHELGELDDARLLRHKIANLFTLFEEVPTDEGLGNLGPGTVEGIDDDGTPLARLEPGSSYRVTRGHKVTFSTPPQDSNDYEALQRVGLHRVSSGSAVTSYEQLTGDMKGVTFSSARISLNEMRRRIERHQQMLLVHQFCRPVWRWWVDAALLSRAITLPAGVEARDVYRVRWQPPGWRYTSPGEEATAARDLVRSGHTSRRRIVAELTGADVEEIDAENAADLERADALGISYDTDPRRPVQGGGGGVAQEPNPTPGAMPGAMPGAKPPKQKGEPPADAQGEADGEEDAA